MQEGKPRELQAGSNGFTCLIHIPSDLVVTF